LIGQQAVEFTHFTIINPVQDIGEPFDRIEVINFAGYQQRIDNGGAFGDL
jgi:hypothetical protein